jgi:competence protein ComEA
MERETRTFLWGWSVRTLRSVLITIPAIALVLAGLSAGLERRGRPVDPRLVIDPNTAPPAVLSALPRLGPVLVGRIVKERSAARFDSLDDLDARVQGIGPATAASLQPFLRFDVTGE